MDIISFVLERLKRDGPKYEQYVVSSIVLLWSRIIKLGWMDAQAYRDSVDQAASFLQAAPQYCYIGLTLLTELVTEMNLNRAGRTLSIHRRTNVNFREYLFKIFQLSLSMLRQLQAAG